MTDQPEALRWAAILEHQAHCDGPLDYKHKAARLLREQHAEIERLRAGAERDKDIVIDAILMTVERNAAEAARYRWLRDRAPPDIGDMASVRDSHDPSEIDAAIDATMGDKP